CPLSFVRCPSQNRHIQCSLTTDYGQRTTDYGQRTTDNGPRTTDCSPTFPVFPIPPAPSRCYNRSVQFPLTRREGVGIFPPSFSKHSNGKVCSRRVRGQGCRGG